MTTMRGKQTEFASRRFNTTAIDDFTRTEKLVNQIRTRAYEIYETRGRSDGRDLDDWLQAEAEVLKQRKVA